MNLYAWILVALFALNGLLTVAVIGRPRQAIGPAEAVGYIVACGLGVLLVVKAAA